MELIKLSQLVCNDRDFCYLSVFFCAFSDAKQNLLILFRASVFLLNSPNDSKLPCLLNYVGFCMSLKEVQC